MQLYIEAKADENWDDLTDLFCDYLTRYENIEGFGIEKLPSLELNRIPGKLMGFGILDGFAACLDHFASWARAQKRLYGHTQGTTLILSDGTQIAVEVIKSH
ncbi:MAG: hypothetical protein OIF57_00460 [Marinobacterium sp.]|nr:hypothetical protein [Marinobacterium sp.]